MSSWRLFHIYKTDLDSLILEFAEPFLARHRDRLERCSWERHSAGGPHLRLRFQAAADVLTETGDRLQREAEHYLSRYPSPDLADYSEDRARALLEKEEATFDDDDLVYRNNQVVERAYSPVEKGYVSQAAADFMEDFHHDVTPLATAVLADTRPRHETVLRLFFLHAVAATGDVKAGSVSWKSHWEGFAATFPSTELLDRIRGAYAAQKDYIAEQLREVRERAADGSLDQDPILKGWYDLVAKYRLYARRRLSDGHQFTLQPKSREEAADMRQTMQSHLLRDSSFVKTFWSDDRFLTSIENDLAFQVPRILVNLFYNFIARVGLSPLDKMVLCHHAQKAVEDAYDCDLQDLLVSNMQGVVERSNPSPSGGLAD